MGFIGLGPLLFSAPRLAGLAAAIILLAGSALLARRLDRRFDAWAYGVLAAALAAGRLGYVVGHAAAFAVAPWRALAVWEGGFDWRWAAAAAVLATPVILRRPRLIAWAGAVLVLAAAASYAVVRLAPPAPQVPLPVLTLRDLEGRPVPLAAADGRPLVINLWASWCPPCRLEAPVLARAAASRPDIRFILADQGEAAPAVRAFLERAGLPPTNVALDPDQALSRHYGARGLPVTLFVNRDGRVADAHFGALSAEQLDDGLSALKP